MVAARSRRTPPGPSVVKKLEAIVDHQKAARILASKAGMDVDADDFRQHYGALSDQALLRLNPDDLTDVARQCYQVELRHRGLKRAVPPRLVEPEPNQPQPVSLGPRYSADNLPWEDSAVSAADYEYAEDAERAR